MSKPELKIGAWDRRSGSRELELRGFKAIEFKSPRGVYVEFGGETSDTFRYSHEAHKWFREAVQLAEDEAGR